MSKAAVDDLLALEVPLIERLHAALPDDVHVLAARDLASITEGTQPTPAVHVLYQGYRPLKQVSAAYEDIEQYWRTVVTVRNAADLIGGQGLRLGAGRLMRQVIDALGPWVPPLPGYKSLHLHAAPDARHRAGFGYFPLGWRVEMRVRVAPNHTRSTET